MTKELTPLEALEKVKFYAGDTWINSTEWNIIETALKKYELMKEIRITARFDLAQVNKEHKALEIIKEKNISARGIMNSPTLEYYIDHCMPRYSEEPTQQEYDLLKEMLL